jgi:hypothetical protein
LIFYDYGFKKKITPKVQTGTVEITVAL